MSEAIDGVNEVLATINGVLWHPVVLWVLLLTGLVFTVWGKGLQLQILVQGARALFRGRRKEEAEPGAISHFQALSAALSATVGLGNIGGVALAIGLGGPGAVFWMWMVGLLGMALKAVEVTLTMIYRNTDDPKNPHGGPMWVARRGFAELGPGWARTGRRIGGFFCVTLLVSTFTGGNFFQAWNVGTATQQATGIPSVVSGAVLAVLVGLVILGGIERIGAVAGRLVPFMCGAYVLAGLFVLFRRYEAIPEVLGWIWQGAFSPLEARGAFLGGTAGFAFATGLQRAFFSNEAGQGSSPIAHSAAQTDEPAREGLVAGLEPLIDTLLICTLTALVILLSGTWDRPADLTFAEAPRVVPTAEGGWTLEGGRLPDRSDRSWRTGDQVEVRLAAEEPGATGSPWHRLQGRVEVRSGEPRIAWGILQIEARPSLPGDGFFLSAAGAAYTARAFDRVQPGLGTWLVTVATWLFALSTLISWSYYGEQGVVYLLGEGWVRVYRLCFCLGIFVACTGVVRTDTELNHLTLLGTGLMLWANVPLTLLFARRAFREFDAFARRSRSEAAVPRPEGPGAPSTVSRR